MPAPITALTALLLLACTDPRLGAFTMPKNLENVRGRLLPFVEGHDVAKARAFLKDHGFDCDPPLPSATDAHAHLCHASVSDAGWSHWTIVLLERRGRIADIQAR
jgi:hypothetical protein